ncbi:MAG: hypothetical protein JEY94_00250 [Melioribacteraceae bacterium]|nr:hypothetical protein [Melioribacteraceae bacterium]
MKKILSLFGLTVIIMFTSCGGRSFTKSPVDEMIRDMGNATTFSIILYDMDESGTFFKNYKHKYRIIKEINEVIDEKMTDWVEVSKDFFYKNENNMGMEIASKGQDGKISKVASPPGYSNYVGNSRYGQWNNSGGTSFWVFYGQYAMMRSLFNMGSYPAYRNSWNNYNTSYRGRTPYYGTKTASGSRFGTSSAYNKKTNPGSRFSSKFSQNSRSGSRFNSKFSSRSRSGGFGK